MKTLELTFKGSLGKKHVFKVHDAKENLNKETVQVAMQSLAGLKLFKDADEFIYATPLAAKYVDTNETVIFDDEAAAKPKDTNL